MVTTDLWIKVKADEVLTGVFACLGILMFLSFTGEGQCGEFYYIMQYESKDLVNMVIYLSHV